MNIKQIIDKIVKEADVQPNEYPIADRLLDVSQIQLKYVELANQLGSSVPISAGEIFTETFVTVDGFNEFTRTMPDIDIFRVDFQPNSEGDFYRIKSDNGRHKDYSWCYTCDLSDCYFQFYADDKRIFIDEGRVGTIRVTYVRGEVLPFTQTDYDNEEEVLWIPKQFQDLLWLHPAWRMASYYKPEREQYLRLELEKLEALFVRHYKRNAKIDIKIKTDDSCGNYR